MRTKIAVFIIVMLIGAGAIVYDRMSVPDTLPTIEAEEKPVVNAAPLPDLTLRNMENGQDFVLGDVDAPVILLHFWATWCAPCVVEFPQLQKLLTEMNGRVKMVAVSLDLKEEPLERFKAKHANPHIIWVHDHAGRLAYSKFLITQLPETIIIDPARLMRDKIIGEYDWSGKDIQDQLNALTNDPI